MILPEIFLDYLRTKATKDQLIDAIDFIFDHYAKEMDQCQDHLEDKQRIINLLDNTNYKQKAELERCYNYQASMKRTIASLRQQVNEANDEKETDKTLN